VNRRFWISIVLLCGLGLPLIAAVDLDGDGMSDLWELLHAAQGLAANADSDGDRLDNRSESIAGTDPFDRASTLAIEGVRTVRSGNVSGSGSGTNLVEGVAFVWTGEPGKRYEVFGNEALSPNGWTTLGVSAIGTGAEIELVIPETNARYFRLQVDDRDRDGDGVADWEEALLGLDPERAQTQAGTDDATLATAAVAAPAHLEVSASAEQIEEGDPVTFTVRRTGGIAPVSVDLMFNGGQTSGTDAFAAPAWNWPDRLDFALFEMEKQFELTPRRGNFPNALEPFSLALQPLGTNAANVPTTIGPASLVKVAFERPTVLSAQLRMLDPALLHFPAWGSATLAILPDRSAAELDWQFEGADLDLLATATPNNPPQLRIGGLTTAWTTDADGRNWIDLNPARLAQLESAQGVFDVGGFHGLFLPHGTPPPAPPTITWTPPTTPSAAAASRLLGQATFGPTLPTINEVQALGMTSWIDAQIALPASHHTDQLLLWDSYGFPPGSGLRVAEWWERSVRSPDQLRQRVAFALSEFFVISDQSELFNFPLAVADYQDMLLDGAFGNFRDLLEDVTLHPAMGMFLSHARNPEASGGIQPDENYAREVMQLFSIGLWELTPDGTRVIGPTGFPVPTYDQFVVEEMARVLTGFSYPDLTPNGLDGFWAAEVQERSPMALFPAWHDDGQKVLIDERILPAGQGGEQDLADALDMLFDHPNTAPFVSRFLIQRLVTSNPSPAYVYRIADVFNTGGPAGVTGVRGDLGAVVKAILLDPEARDPAVAAQPWFGQLREPLLRATALLRAFDAKTIHGRVRVTKPQVAFGQGPLQAPSVFNFFEPDFALPGPVAEAGLVSPEFKILSANNALRIANSLRQTLEDRMPAANELIEMDYSAQLPLAGDVDALLDQLDILLMHGHTTPALRSEIATVVTDIPTNEPRARVEAAVHLMVLSPEYAIFR